MPRRKIAKPKDLADLAATAEGLPDLTAQQFDFVRGILDGLTGADAYRKAYDCSKMLDRTIWAAASRLRNDADVSAWIAASRKAELGTAVVTRDQHVRRLDRLASIAIETGNVGAAVQAEQLIGKVQGHYVERFEDLTETDPLSTLDRIRKDLGDDVADMLAHRANLTH